MKLICTEILLQKTIYTRKVDYHEDLYYIYYDSLSASEKNNQHLQINV